MARIQGVDLPPSKRVDIGLTYMFGIGRSKAVAILETAKVDGSIKVKDLGSANGTWHDGARVADVTLTDGAEVRFGEVLARFETI